MLTTFYTYCALADEWDSLLTGMAVNGAYSGSKNELVVEISEGSRLVFGVRGSFRYLFRSERSGRPRKNVTDLLPCVNGMSIDGVRIADRDRLIRIDGTQSSMIFVLYGSQPNVLATRDGIVVDAFKSVSKWVGKPEPEGRSADEARSLEEFKARTAGKPVTNRKAVSRAFPLFDKELIAEVLYRAGLDSDAVFDTDFAKRLYSAGSDIRRQLEEDAAPRIYWDADQPVAFSLIELRGRELCREETFDSTDGAVSVFCRRRLAVLRYSERFKPLLQTVADAAARAKKRQTELEAHLQRESRADTYERWAHILMASGRGDEVGLSSISLPDLFADSKPTEIPLQEELTVIENAEEYYERARRSRLSRQAAAGRLANVSQEAEALAEDLAVLSAVTSPDELDEFVEERGDRLGKHWGLLQVRGSEAPSRFRRFDLGSFEVLVGRNAKENDELTFGMARKYDIFMHARGVPGSHTILRLPSRDANPDRHVLEIAASIAAYFSKARGSGLVPVSYAPRKYVRKAKGSVSGKVILEREEVVIVPPALPEK